MLVDILFSNFQKSRKTISKQISTPFAQKLEYEYKISRKMHTSINKLLPNNTFRSKLFPAFRMDKLFSYQLRILNIFYQLISLD